MASTNVSTALTRRLRLTLVEQTELEEDRADVLLDGALAHVEGAWRWSRCCGRSPSARAPTRSLSVSPLSGELASPALRVHQPLDDLRVEGGAAARDVAQGADELVDVRDPLLEQVAEPRDAVGEQLEGVVLLDVLREHHHADRRVVGPDLLGRIDALGGVGRRHPDVGEHGVGLVLGHGLQQRLRVGHAVDEIDLVDLGEQGRDALPHQEVVVGQHDAKHHARG